MGLDKTTLTDGGETLVASTVDRLEQVCETVVVADRGRRLDRRSVTDGPGNGPVAGILGAARVYPNRALLVLACDLPNVPAPLLAGLAAGEERVDWRVPSLRGHLEPLCALYGPAAIAALELRVRSGRFALHALREVDAVRLEIVDETWIARFGDPEELLLNLNTPAELERWRRGRGGPSASGSAC